MQAMAEARGDLKARLSLDLSTDVRILSISAYDGYPAGVMARAADKVRRLGVINGGRSVSRREFTSYVGRRQ